MAPTKYQEWMINCAVQKIGKSYHIWAKLIPGCGQTTGIVLHILQRLKLKAYRNPAEAILFNHDSVPGRTIRAVVICSTREAAYATKDMFDKLATNLDFRCALFVGGESVQYLVQQFKNGLDVAVCCIGMLTTMMKIHKNLLKNTRILCFDNTKTALEATDDRTTTALSQIVKLSR